MALQELTNQEMKQVEGGQHSHPTGNWKRWNAWLNKGAVNPGVKSEAVLENTGPGHNNGQGNN